MKQQQQQQQKKLQLHNYSLPTNFENTKNHYKKTKIDHEKNPSSINSAIISLRLYLSKDTFQISIFFIKDVQLQHFSNENLFIKFYKINLINTKFQKISFPLDFFT